MRYTKHPGAIDALSMALIQTMGVKPAQAVQAAVQIMDICERHRVMVIPEAMTGLMAQTGADPFTLLAQMAESIEEEFGRKPWLPET